MKHILTFLSLTLVLFVQASSFVKVTDAEDLRAGDTLVFINENALCGNTSIANTNKYIEVASVTISNSVVVSSDLCPFVLGGKEGSWTLTYLNGKQLIRDTRSGKEKQFYTSGASTFTISFDANGNAVVTSAGSTYRIFYNAQTPRFAFYNSNTMSPIQLYRKLPDAAGPAIAVTDVKVSPSSLSLRVGETQGLTVTIYPQDAKNKNVSFVSSDEQVLSVSEQGLVTALQKGSAIVTVTTEDGDYTTSCEVTVLESLTKPMVTYHLVQHIDSLYDGVRVFLGNPAEENVLGIYDNGIAKSNIHGVAATYGDVLHHSVTASESYTYIVHRAGDNYAFEDVDGNYLYMYGTNKNLSSSATCDSKGQWMLTVGDSVTTLRSVYDNSWQILYNKSADLYCTYSAKDNNMADIYLYSNNAPEWAEPVLYPELTILYGKDTLTDVLDWGKVLYDDSWGTEVNPYEEAKTIQVYTKDVRSSVAISLYQGTVFSSYTSSLPAKGGSVSVQFSTKTSGTYTDTLYISVGDIHRKIVLKASTSKGEELLPQLKLPLDKVSLNPNLKNNLTDYAEFSFMVKNLTKNLYIKWEKGTIPDHQGEYVTILAGNEGVELDFGSAVNMGTEDRQDEPVLVEVYAFMPGTYVSTLCFYTVDPNDKSRNLFEERVTLTIKVDEQLQPTAVIENENNASLNGKFLRNGQLVFQCDGIIYDATGKRLR